MKVLVTGGSGFIGSRLIRKLLSEGNIVLNVDPKRSRKQECEEINKPIQNVPLKNFADLDAIIHLASDISISESISNPLKYFDNNLRSTLAVAAIGLKYRTPIHFASSAAVYGLNGYNEKQRESSTLNPMDAYGLSKKMSEQILRNSVDSVPVTIFRYFNVAGPGYDKDPAHIIPILHNKFKTESPITIYGKSFPTRDGTCERDFVHVDDIVNAHMIALKPGRYFNGTFNLGSGRGTTVLELYNMMKPLYPNSRTSLQYGQKRSYDTDRLVADITAASHRLGWYPQRDIHTIVAESA